MQFSSNRLEQFNDVLAQENSLHQEDGAIQWMVSPLLDTDILNYVAKNNSTRLETIKVRTTPMISQIVAYHVNPFFQ